MAQSVFQYLPLKISETFDFSFNYFPPYATLYQLYIKSIDKYALLTGQTGDL